MSNATSSHSPVRKGGFRAAKKLFGIEWPWAYVSTVRFDEFKKVFAAEYVAEVNGFFAVQLDSHNAMYVLQDRLAVLCNLWNIERISVVDYSDWTIREFVLDEIAEEKK